MPLLRAMCVMVVEDDALLAMDLSTTLCDHGYRPVGPFASIAPAIDAVKHARPDAAVLDMDLNGVMSVPVADALASANVPFLWMSGSPAGILPVHHRVRPFLPKPVAPSVFLSAVTRLFNATST